MSALCKADAMTATRQYRRVGIAWNDPDAVRAFNREAQRRWRAINAPRKRDRNVSERLRG